MLKLMITFLLAIASTITIAAQKCAYHGSPSKFNFPTPQQNEREDNGKITWSGRGVFASFDRRIALIYTGKHPDPQYKFLVNLNSHSLEDQPITLQLTGGKSAQEALEHLYGANSNSDNTGYIYCLHEHGFTRENGLGEMEMVTRNSPRLINAETINRRAELDNYLQQGLVKIVWKANE